MLTPTLCDDQSVPFDDRGLAYGDGLFETVLLRTGKPVLWRYHRERLAQGCHRLGLPLPCQEALDATWQGDPTAEFEVLKLILTRGSGGPSPIRSRRGCSVVERRFNRRLSAGRKA